MTHYTYKQLGELWTLDAQKLYRAKSELGETLVDGEHYQTGDRGELQWLPDGVALLATHLGQPLPTATPDRESVSPSIDVNGIADELAHTMAEQLAPQTAQRFWQIFPMAVLHQVRVMGLATPEAIRGSFYGAFGNAIGEAIAPNALGEGDA